MKHLLFGLFSLISLTLNGQEMKQIQETVETLFSATDARDWEAVQYTFADKVLLDYSSMSGQSAMEISPEQIVTAWQALLPGFDKTDHQIRNLVVAEKGNKATVSCEGIATHYLAHKGENVWTVAGSYDFELEKGSETWQVSLMRFNLESQSGNTTLPQLAMQRLQPSTAERNKSSVRSFFEALENENVDAIVALFAEDGKHINPYHSGIFPQGAEGKAGVRAYWEPVFPNFDGMRFPIAELYALENPNKVYVKFQGEIKLKEGAGYYRNDYYALFTFNEQGEISEYVEIFNPLVAARGFGIDLTQTPQSTEINHSSMQKVHFPSEGLTLAGNLYLPPNFDENQQYPAIVVSGSWTTVKEQMAGLYAQNLAEAGFITLAFDFRNFGESEGEPRFYESPALKKVDVQHAVSFLTEHPSVDADRIGAFGVCAGAMYTVMAASEDKRIKSVVTAASWLHDAEAVKLFYGGEEGVQAKITAAQQAKKTYAQNGEVVYIPSISTEDASAAMYGPYDYYLNPERGAVKEWSADKFAVMSWEDWLTTDPMPTAKNLSCPTLMIHSDGAVLPQYTKNYFEAIGTEDKRLHWMDTELESPFHQFNYYDQEAEVSESVSEAVSWFKEKM